MSEHGACVVCGKAAVATYDDHAYCENCSTWQYVLKLEAQLAAAIERAGETGRLLVGQARDIAAATIRANDAEDARDGFAADLDAAEDAKRKAEGERESYKAALGLISRLRPTLFTGGRAPEIAADALTPTDPQSASPREGGVA